MTSRCLQSQRAIERPVVGGGGPTRKLVTSLPAVTWHGAVRQRRWWRCTVARGGLAPTARDHPLRLGTTSPPSVHAGQIRGTEVCRVRIQIHSSVNVSGRFACLQQTRQTPREPNRADGFVHRHQRRYWFDEHDSLQSAAVPCRWPEAVSGTVCSTSSHQLSLRLSLFSGIDLKPACSVVRSCTDWRLYTV